jgi:drug/metabolite transporter (DMT)-like permease
VAPIGSNGAHASTYRFAMSSIGLTLATIRDGAGSAGRASYRYGRVPTMTSSLRGWLPAFAVLAAVWGLSFVFIAVAVHDVAPVYLALARIAIGAVVLGLALLVRRERLPREPRLWAHLAILGLVGTAVPFTLFGYAEERVSSVLAGIWNGAAPLTTLLVTMIALRVDRPSRRQIGGLLIGALGVLVVLGVWHGVGRASLLGQLMLLGAVSCYGIAFNHIRWIVRRWPESPLALSAGQLLTATVELAVLAPLIAGAPPSPAALPLKVIGSLVALGALGTGLAFVLNFHVVRAAGVTTASTVTYVTPVIAAAAGILLLGERISWNQPVGGCIVLAGVAVSQGVLARRGTGRGPASGARSGAESGAGSGDASLVRPGPVE